MIEYRLLERTPEALEPVWRLTHDAYVREGYATPQPDGLLRHFPKLDMIPETRVIGAFEGEELIGTNSLTADGSLGLHVDETFPDLLREIRSECCILGLRLGASWRIATAERYRGNRHLVLGLIDKSVDVAVEMGLDVVLFSFNPRHTRIYARLLDLETLCSPRPETAVVGAPAVLMRGDMDRILRRWRGP